MKWLSAGLTFVNVATVSALFLGMMAGGIAHEINNPVGIIHAMASDLAETAKEGSVTPEDVARLVRMDGASPFNARTTRSILFNAASWTLRRERKIYSEAADQSGEPSAPSLIRTGR